MLFVGLFLVLLCQVGLSPSEGLHVPFESGPGAASHGMATCGQSPLMASPTPLVTSPNIITPVVVVILGTPSQGYTLPFYRPPRPTA